MSWANDELLPTRSNEPDRFGNYLEVMLGVDLDRADHDFEVWRDDHPEAWEAMLSRCNVCYGSGVTFKGEFCTACNSSGRKPGR